MTDLTDRLRALSRMEHSDYTIGYEAADEIDRLRVQGLMWRDERDALQSSLDAAEEQAAANCDEVLRLRDALELIAAPMRPDGTWNRERLACQQIAVEALKGTP